MTELIDALREELGRLVVDEAAPPPATLARVAADRGRRTRRRRRTAAVALAAAAVAAVVLPVAGGWTGSAPAPTPVPATSSPSALVPTPAVTASPQRSWRVTKRCRPHPGNVCSRLDAVAIEVDGTEYWNRFGGEQPLDQQDRGIELSVGRAKGRFVVLGGVVSRSGTYVSYSLLVDGRSVAHYPDGRVRLLPVPPGRHEVRLVADATVERPGTTIAVAEFEPLRPRR
jgi:hypothetical protein